MRARWWWSIALGLLGSLTAALLAATLAADLAVGGPIGHAAARTTGPEHAAVALTPAEPSPAEAPAELSRTEGTLLRLVNRDRAAAELPAYQVAGDLMIVARSWALVLAGTGELAHNPQLGRQITGYQAAGENVGHGPDPATVHAAFLASPSHRANVLDADYTQAGIAVAPGLGDRLWVVQVFRQPALDQPRWVGAS